MDIIDVSQIDESVNLKKFTVLSDNEYPCCILGFKIKNKYDQLRYKIPSKYRSNDYTHFVYSPETMPVFFRGIRLNPSSRLVKLTNELTHLEKHQLSEITLPQYSMCLAGHDLSCDECLCHLQPGVYPINSSCIDKLTDSQINITELYEDIFANASVPYFQSIGYMSIFILSNSNKQNTNNKKMLKSIVDNYKILKEYGLNKVTYAVQGT